MIREQFVLTVLASNPGVVYTPAQVQKIFFLIDKKMSRTTGGPFFEFKPYHYGPFDKSIFDELSALKRDGKIELLYSDRLRTYLVTEKGQEESKKLQNQLKSKTLAEIKELVKFITDLPFQKLISFIYKEYPEMKVNSIFS